MLRQARLDAPDTLHHVMLRGLERRAIFRDDADREDFVARVAALAESGALTVYAWALLPNRAHLLVRTGTRPLAPVLGTQPAAVPKAVQRGTRTTLAGRRCWGRTVRTALIRPVFPRFEMPSHLLDMEDNSFIASLPNKAGLTVLDCHR